MHESKEQQPSDFLSLSATVTGKWSAWLLLMSLLPILLNTLAVMPQTDQRAGLELAQQVYNLTVFLCVFSSGITGLWAIVRKRERYWVLFTSVLLLVLALALNIGSMFEG